MGYTWAQMNGAESAKGARPGKPIKNRQITKDLRAAMRKTMPDCNPLLRLLELAEDEKTDLATRVSCYQAVLPYVVSKSTPTPIDPDGTITFEARLAKARMSGGLSGVDGLADRLERARTRMGPDIRKQLEDGLREVPLSEFDTVGVPVDRKDITSKSGLGDVDLDHRGNIIRSLPSPSADEPPEPPEPFEPPTSRSFALPTLSDAARAAIRRAAMRALNPPDAPNYDPD